MPQILPPSAWLEFRGFPKGKTFNQGAMHFAIVKGQDGKERKCAVKFIDLQTRPGLICEGLGWLLAQAVGANVPAFAAILRVPLAELAKSMPLPPFLSGYIEYPAWCVEIVEGKAVSQVHRWIFWLERLKCLNAKNTPVIASFDYWADNQDRNFGNVIKSKEGRYVAIDHETLLHQVLYVPYGITFGLNSLLEEAAKRLSADKLHRFKCDMAMAAMQHGTGVQAVRTSGKLFVQSLIPDPTAAAKIWSDIETFLDLRSQSGWMSNELGVIV
jgi:hypothetical protein